MSYYTSVRLFTAATQGLSFFNATPYLPLAILGWFLIIISNILPVASFAILPIITLIMSYCSVQSSAMEMELSLPVKDIKQEKKTKKKVLLTQEKKKKKEKRHKKSKTMEDDKENLWKGPTTSKILTSLKQFDDLKMTRDQIHQHLQQYLLCNRDLMMNRFPVPGVATNVELSAANQVRRKCYRCLQHFEVTLDGKYLTEDICTYHPQRKVFVADNHQRLHPCCNKPSGSPGCSTFPLHVCGEPILHQSVFESVREKRQVRSDQLCGVYALDCEMIYTGVGLQVAKVGLVDSEGLTVLESYVRPDNEVVDYCTTYSGVTPKHLKGVTTTLRDIQVFLDKLLNHDSILVGHGLEGDLRALRISHNKIVDTSVIFPRWDGTKQKLRDLARDHLGMVIQNDPSGHDCIEDARACMALMLNKIKADQNNVLVDINNNILPQCRFSPYNHPSFLRASFVGSPY